MVVRERLHGVVSIQVSDLSRSTFLLCRYGVPTLTAVFASSSLARDVAPSVMRLELRFARDAITVD